MPEPRDIDLDLPAERAQDDPWVNLDEVPVDIDLDLHRKPDLARPEAEPWGPVGDAGEPDLALDRLPADPPEDPWGPLEAAPAPPPPERGSAEGA